MRKLKNFFIIALVFAIVLSFAACAQKDSDWDESDEEGANKDISGNKENDNDTGKTDIAAIISGKEINSVQMNYYLTDHIWNMYSQWQTTYGTSIDMYLGLMKLDTNKPLNEQVYNLETNQTWADYFLNEALAKAKSDYALYSKAMADDFQLTPEHQATLDNELKNMLNEYAALYGYKDADKFLQARYGKGSSLESYAEYTRISTIASAYYVNHYESLTYDDAAIREYEKNKESYYSSFSNAPLVNVRHLLIAFEGSTDAEKLAAKAEAERILRIWEEGIMTEESFINLVKNHTDDEASKETGGLCEDIHPQSLYVETFLNWSVDPERKVGDTGIIASEYGYHIMYFSSHDELTYRDYRICEDMRNRDIESWYNAITESTTANLIATKNLNMNIVLVPLASS